MLVCLQTTLQKRTKSFIFGIHLKLINRWLPSKPEINLPRPAVKETNPSPPRLITDPAYISSIFVHGPLPLIPFISWLLFEKSANFGRDCKNSDQTFPLHFSVHSSFSATHLFLHSLTMPLCSIFTPLQSLCALWQLHALEPPDVRSAVCCKQGSGERTGTSL